MQYLPGVLTALLLSALTFLVVILTLNLTIRILGRPSRFPVLPKYSPELTAGLTDLDFEEFIVERFDPGHFRLMKWSHKYTGNEPGIEPGAFPDLEYQARVHQKNIPFAVECEWRAAFNGEAIDLSGFRLHPRYRRPGTETDMPVFLVIGVGGTQAAPKECFILPMEVIQPHFTFLSFQFLEPFRRKQADSILFLDVNQMILR